MRLPEPAQDPQPDLMRESLKAAGVPAEVIHHVDGFNEAARVLCEAYAHLGKTKGDQPAKLAKDILKLLTVERVSRGTWRKVLCLVDEEAAACLRRVPGLPRLFKTTASYYSVCVPQNRIKGERPMKTRLALLAVLVLANAACATRLANQESVEQFDALMRNEEFRRAHEEVIRLAFEVGEGSVSRKPCVRWSENLCTVDGLCCASCSDSRCSSVIRQTKLTNKESVEQFDALIRNEEFRRAHEEVIRLAFEVGEGSVSNRAPCVQWSGDLCTVYGLCCASCSDSRCD
jgi:hypothetical protein